MTAAPLLFALSISPHKSESSALREIGAPFTQWQAAGSGRGLLHTYCQAVHAGFFIPFLRELHVSLPD